MKNNNAWLPALAFIGMLLFWEVAVLSFSDYAFVLPAPSAIAQRIFERWDRFLFHTRITVGEMAGGIFFAFTAAFPLAWMMWVWGSARRILQPLFVIIQCIPMFTLAPIMVIWFGWSYTAIVVPTALMIFFPLTMNIYQGLKSVPKHMIDYFRLNGATRWQIFTKLQLPWAVPHIFAGFRISTAIAGIGAVAGEWAGAQAGLGLLMIESRRATDLTTTFGALFCVAFISLSVYGLTALFEKRFIFRKVLPLLLALFLFQGCQSQDKGETRLLLDWLPNPNHVPLYVGIENGYFAEQGINLTIRKLQDPSDTVAYLTSRQADLVVYYMPNVIRANHRGAGLKPVGVLFKESLNGIIYRSNIGIATIDDLNNKKIGYCVDGTQAKTLNYIFKTNEISPNATLNVNFDLVSALGTGQVDALYGAYWNIECEHLRSLGVETEHFTLKELGFPNYYELIVLAKEGTPMAEEGFRSRFQEALQQSIVFCKEHPREAFSVYQRQNPDKSPETLGWELEAWKKTVQLLASDQQFDWNEWEIYRAWMTLHGLLGNK